MKRTIQDIVGEYQHNSEPAVRQNACVAYAALGDPASLEALLDIGLNDSDHSVRKFVEREIVSAPASARRTIGDLLRQKLREGQSTEAYVLLSTLRGEGLSIEAPSLPWIKRLRFAWKARDRISIVQQSSSGFGIIQEAIVGALLSAVAVGAFISLLLGVDAFEFQTAGISGASLLVAPALSVVVSRQMSPIVLQYDRLAATLVEIVFVSVMFVLLAVLMFFCIMLLEGKWVDSVIRQSLIISIFFVIAIGATRMGEIIGNLARLQLWLTTITGALSGIAMFTVPLMVFPLSDLGAKYWIALTPCFGGIAPTLAGVDRPKEFPAGEGGAAYWRIAVYAVLTLVVILAIGMIAPSYRVAGPISCANREGTVTIDSLPFTKDLCAGQRLKMRLTNDTSVHVGLRNPPKGVHATMKLLDDRGATLDDDETPNASVDGALKAGRDYTVIIQAGPNKESVIDIARRNLRSWFVGGAEDVAGQPGGPLMLTVSGRVRT